MGPESGFIFSAVCCITNEKQGVFHGLDSASLYALLERYKALQMSMAK